MLQSLYSLPTRSQCEAPVYTMKMPQFAFHDQFVFSGPLDEIQKSVVSRLVGGKLSLIIFFIAAVTSE